MPTNNALNITAAGLVTYNGSGAFTATTYTDTTFTPVLTFNATTGITYTDQVGYYTQIGNIIHFSINISLTSKGSSTGSAFINGLPVAASATTAGYACMGYALGMTSFPGSTDTVIGTINANQTRMAINGYLGPAAGTLTQFSYTNFSNTSVLMVFIESNF